MFSCIVVYKPSWEIFSDYIWRWTCTLTSRADSSGCPPSTMAHPWKDSKVPRTFAMPAWRAVKPMLLCAGSRW